MGVQYDVLFLYDGILSIMIITQSGLAPKMYFFKSIQ